MTGPRILLTHGARAAERLVADRVAELHDAARRDLALLARPVRIVVPSVSLRDHLEAALVERCGALAGVQVSTLFSVALELLHAAGHGAGRVTALFDVVARRCARTEPVLRARLDDLDDGYAVVAAAVRDLLDAGFEPVHAAALEELLADDGPALATGDEIARAGAVVRVAAAAEESLAALGLTPRSALLGAARDALEAGGPELLPARELLVHGFADATGVVTDLLESLLRVLDGTLVLDRPPAAAGGHESAHTERLALRLMQVARAEDVPSSAAPSPPAAARVVLLAAPDPEAEARAVAQRVRRLLADGVRPERIGVVARDLAGCAVVLRRHCRVLGVPFSGGRAPGPLGPAGRDLALLAELLRRGPALALERWLDALADFDPSRRSEVRLALLARGASRLADLARVEVAGGDELAAVVAAGRELAAELEAWREGGEMAFAEHVERLGSVLRTEKSPPAPLFQRGEDDSSLRIGSATEGVGAGVRARREASASRPSPPFEKGGQGGFLREVLADLDVPPTFPLSYDEFVLVLTAAFEGRGAEPLGGRGGGVQVLDVTEARGRTFEHLFLVAARRDVFPRPVREDPLLPDRLRHGLARLLPDLPIKASGFDEERYLFAQLLSAAPRVTVSWPERDAAGDATAPSPLVERLRRRLCSPPRSPPRGPDAPVTVERAPPLLDAGESERPVEEALLVRALHGSRRAFTELLPLAFEELDPGVAPAVLAAGRAAVLEELDPDRRGREGRARSRLLGPYFGFVGAAEPRAGDVYVTTLENLAACPWQTFLRRVLRVEPMPDPLAALPSLRGRLLGLVVHRALERIAVSGLGSDTAAWPPPAELDALLAAETERVLGEQGLTLPGLARAAAELARPYLEAARQADWAEGGPAVRAVEAAGAVALEDREGRRRRVRFKADRVDDGPVFTDYKTGTRGAARPEGRDALLARVAGGQWLQAAAYAHGPGAAGRYLFLRPDLDAALREVRMESADDELRAVFAGTARTLLAAWDAGVFFPRLLEPHDDVEPPRCRSCRVAEACLRRDSGARGRLRRWVEVRREAGADDAFLDLWELYRPSS